MITVRIKGGLGNQLFQYATAYALAKRLDTELQLDTSFFPQQTLRGYKLEALFVQAQTVGEEQLPRAVKLYKNKYLNRALRQLNLQQLSCGKGWKYMLETRSDLVPSFFTVSGGNIYMDGYYQSEQYFLEYRQELLEQFRPAYAEEAEAVQVRRALESCNSIAVHVRRGDFLNAQNDSNPRHYLLGADYYERALKYMDGAVEAPQYYWFSDDIEWVKTNFGDRENYHFVSLKTTHSDIDEMQLMATCRHIITANSTFSWWAAWMNERDDAIRVVPAKRYGNVRMIPENWIRL